MSVSLRFLGSGTPLGLGGRHQACMLLETSSGRLLVECGMTALASLGREGIDPSEIDAVVVSHLHGDHFGGVPLLLLDAAIRRRARPLTVAGPATLRERVESALRALGWGSAGLDTAAFVALQSGVTTHLAGFEVHAIEVAHDADTSPTGLRLHGDGVTIAFSGDAAWSPALADLARDADLFVCNVWWFNTVDPTFLDLATLIRHREELNCKRLIVSHLGPDLLARQSQIPFEVASDGLVVEF